ncbi:MAG: hypothetical protein HY051_01045 [Candidatus Aenigmarchaeota archaeon]|nr:hypothetical protein [Candidatus Aenigmarchaeota archaeon]
MSRLDNDSKHVHFRKFLSQRLLLDVLSACPGLERITLSKYAYKRASFDALQFPGIRFFISSRKAGRPNRIG